MFVDHGKIQVNLSRYQFYTYLVPVQVLPELKLFFFIIAGPVLQELNIFNPVPADKKYNNIFNIWFWL